MTSGSTGPVVALLTGGADEPYAYGLATALMSKGILLDLIANDELDRAEFRGDTRVHFLNLRGDQRPNASLPTKIFRVSVYYLKLIRYAATARPRIFHILWNNKFELFDRTALMAYYKLLGKRIVYTAHNVNGGKRDRRDSCLNRLTLRIQYKLCDHIFVHTEKMKRELVDEFDVPEKRVSVIPFGTNNAVPITQLASTEARQRLGIAEDEKAILFFGNIAPYKGLEDLIRAFTEIGNSRNEYRLIIAGKPKCSKRYWASIQKAIDEDSANFRVLLRAEYIPDSETELYFKSADVLVLPYRHIYQSGVLFLGHSFGLPVLASDVGSLRDDIIEGETGFVFRPANPGDLARTIERYFGSDLYLNLANRRSVIRGHSVERHSWDTVSHITTEIYVRLLADLSLKEPENSVSSSVSAGSKTSPESL